MCTCNTVHVALPLMQYEIHHLSSIPLSCRLLCQKRGKSHANSQFEIWCGSACACAYACVRPLYINPMLRYNEIASLRFHTISQTIGLPNLSSPYFKPAYKMGHRNENRNEMPHHMQWCAVQPEFLFPEENAKQFLGKFHVSSFSIIIRQSRN